MEVSKDVCGGSDEWPDFSFVSGSSNARTKKNTDHVSREDLQADAYEYIIKPNSLL